MSYVTLVEGAKSKVKERIMRYVSEKFKDDEVIFNQMFFLDIDREYEVERFICRGIKGDGTLFGRDANGDDAEWTMEGLSIEELTYIIDQLLETNYKVLTQEF